MPATLAGTSNRSVDCSGVFWESEGYADREPLEIRHGSVYREPRDEKDPL